MMVVRLDHLDGIDHSRQRSVITGADLIPAPLQGFLGLEDMKRDADLDSVTRMKAAEESLEAKEKDKQKPSFELSGKLAEETNRVRGVTLLFNEPADARKPDIRWRLYVFKAGQVLNDPLYVHRQSCYLFGRERRTGGKSTTGWLIIEASKLRVRDIARELSHVNFLNLKNFAGNFDSSTLPAFCRWLRACIVLVRRHASLLILLALLVFARNNYGNYVQTFLMYDFVFNLMFGAICPVAMDSLFARSTEVICTFIIYLLYFWFPFASLLC